MKASHLFGAIATVSLAVIGLSTPASANCYTGNCWGAVAYGPNSESAWVVNHSTQASAKSRALAKCTTCTRVLTFQNTCGAYVTGSGGHGWATSRNRQEAVGSAMMQCSKVAKNCTLRVWACTTR
jgi:hypothetical protein